MSTLRELDASAEAAEACERAAVSLKRATRDVEASARGFGLEPNAVARARQLCAEVTRLASRTDAAIAAAQDAAALEASRTIHDAFLTPAEDRAATRERLASAPAEPVRVQLVRFRDPKSANANAITAPRAPCRSPLPPAPRPRGTRRCDPDADARSARDAMRALLIEVRKKLDAPTAVAGLFRVDGARVLDPRAVRDGETLVAKMASDERLEGPESDDASSYAPLTRGVSHHTTAPGGATTSRPSCRGSPPRTRGGTRRAPGNTPSRRTRSRRRRRASPKSGLSGPSGGALSRVPPARRRKAPASEKKTQSAKDAELARPKPVWVRSFAVRLRVRAEECGKANVEKLVSMRVPEKGLEGMSLVTLRRRVALACGFKAARRSPCGFRPGAGDQAPRRAQARLRARGLRRLYPGRVGDAREKPLSRRRRTKKTGAAAESSPALDFAPSCPPPGSVTRARVGGSSRVRRRGCFRA